MKIEFENSVTRLSFLGRLPDIQVAWISPCEQKLVLLSHVALSSSVAETILVKLTLRKKKFIDFNRRDSNLGFRWWYFSYWQKKSPKDDLIAASSCSRIANFGL